jgi:hypothetical protein
MLEDGIFTLYTTLEQQGVPLTIREAPSKGDMDYSSYSSLTITSGIGANGQVTDAVKAKVGVSLEFDNKKSILFQTLGVKSLVIENLDEVQTVALANYKSDKWSKDWVLISEIVHMDSSTIIISTGKKNTLEFEASGDIATDKIQLADVSAGLKLVREAGSSTKIITSQGLTPLYRVKGVRHPLFRKPELRTKGMTGTKLAEDLNQLRDLEFDTKEIE